MPLVFAVPAAIVALLTLTASLAAVFRVGRLKAALEVSERAAAAWEDERDAAVAKADRLENQVDDLSERVLELETTNKRLQEQRDLTRYFDQQDINHREVVEELHAVADANKSLATAIEVLAAMLRPFTAAQ